MSINELIEQIGGRKRLEQIVEFGQHVPVPEAALMARALLAVLDVKPVWWIDSTVELPPQVVPGRFRNDIPDAYLNCVETVGGIPLYDTPPAARVPEGWKLVPVDATPDILQAGISAHYARQQYAQPEDAKFIGPMESAYNAMLAAAPDLSK